MRVLKEGADDGVIVGLRIRPLLQRDHGEGATECLRKVQGEPQVVLGNDRAFTFNHVLDPAASQADLFDQCMCPIVGNVLEGYNATILAYGQTGSGKTHTMGTAEEASAVGESAGLIPRALDELFARANSPESGMACSAQATFIEIYKEEVHDLLNFSEETQSVCTLPIRENGEGGGLTLTGQKSKPVASVAEAMAVLSEGASNRATGATAMNATSSRSHAIFTLSLQLRMVDGKSFSPKLHFVDLAGSERAKRTGATGERLQEGIQINKGLLALGNVINALCEKHNHVPYRDSKLTRLLQDSLGGNSKTMMLACVSPGDTDLEETLNTLKYANRARQIRNKPVIAQDPMQARIAELMETINTLQARLSHYEAGGAPLPPLASSLPTTSAGDAVGMPMASTGVDGRAAPSVDSSAGPDAVLLRRVTQLGKENDMLRQRITSLLRGGAVPAAAETKDQDGRSYPEGVPDVGMVSVSSDGGSLAALKEDSLLLGDADASRTSLRTSTGSAGSADSAELREDSALAQEEMEAELEFLAKQGELSEQIEGLNASLALKQALLAQQPDILDEGTGEASKEDLNTLCEALASLENRLKGVESERDSFQRQVTELRMHSDEEGKPSKAAEKRLEQLSGEIAKLKKQRAQQEALLKARQASDQRVKQLEGEISHIKASKAAIARRQREEADAHRAQRIARERELIQLKRKEERTAAQLSKLEGEHAKQTAVLKRKQEEVTAAQKRLKLQEQSHSAAHARRTTVGPGDRPGGGGGGGITPRGSFPPASSLPGSTFGSSVKGGSFGFGGPAGPSGNSGSVTLRDNVGGGQLSTRKPGGGGGVSGTTESQRARLETKKAEEKAAVSEKAASAIAVDAKKWLKMELEHAVEHHKLSHEVSVEIEKRRQAALQLQAFEVQADAAAVKTEAMDVTDADNGEAAAAASARAAQVEALKIKITHHTSQVQSLQSRLLVVSRGEGEKDAVTFKLDALTRVDHAKSLLKAAVPQLLQKTLEIKSKDAILEAQRRDLQEHKELADGLRLQLFREKKVAEEQLHARERDLIDSAREVKELRNQLSSQSVAAATLAAAEAREQDEAKLRENEAKNKNAMSALDLKLAAIKTAMNQTLAAAADEAAQSEAKAAEAAKVAAAEPTHEEIDDHNQDAEDTPSDEDDESDSGMESDASDWLETEDAKGRRSLGGLDKRNSGGESDVTTTITCDVCSANCYEESYFAPETEEDICPACYGKDPSKFGGAKYQREGKDAPKRKAPAKPTAAKKAVAAAAEAAPVTGAFDDLDDEDDVEEMGDDGSEARNQKSLGARPKRAAAAVSEAKLVAVASKKRRKRPAADSDEAEEGDAEESDEEGTGPMTKEPEARPADSKQSSTIPIKSSLSEKPPPKAPAQPRPPPGKPAKAKPSAAGSSSDAAVPPSSRAALGKLEAANYNSSEEAITANPAASSSASAKVAVSDPKFKRKTLYNPKAGLVGPPVGTTGADDAETMVD